MMIQVYGVYTIQVSVLMFLGIAIFSPMIAIAQWLGAILACFTGLFLILCTLYLSYLLSIHYFLIASHGLILKLADNSVYHP